MITIAKPKVVVSVDPGLELGYAVWPASQAMLGPVEAPTPCHWGVCRGGKASSRLLEPSMEPEWAQRGVRAVRELEEALQGLCVERAFVELPGYWNNAFGQSVAIRGDLVKLSFAVGAVTFLLQKLGASVKLVPVQEWKGMMPKGIVERRIRDRLREHPVVLASLESHSWDAVGIGLHCLGVSLCRV